MAEPLHVHGYQNVLETRSNWENNFIVFFQMIILLYLIVILGWALLILIIKCRKAREKRIALAQQEAQIDSAVHVIQIGNTFYDVIPISNPSASVTRCHHHSHCRRGYQMRHCDSENSLNANSHTNPTFVMDEGIFPSSEFKFSADLSDFTSLKRFF